MPQPSVYRIRVRATLGPEWSSWFEGVEVDTSDGSTSTLTGRLDQAALHGLLAKVRDLGLEIASVETLDRLHYSNGRRQMKYFDGSFFAGTVLALVAIAVAYLALSGPGLPVIGNGRGTLIAVAIIGFFSCSIGGISQASELGWTDPVIILGSVIGLVAIAIVGAGLLGWNAPLQSIAQFVPGTVATGASADRLAIGLLAAVIAVKWLVDVALAAARSLSAG